MAASVITRASLVDNVTLWSAATVNSAVYDAIDSMFGGAGSYTTFEFGGALKVTGALTPVTNDGAAIGSGTVSWADLFLASGGVINFANGDVTITHSTNTLTFAGAASGYIFNDGNVGLGVTPSAWDSTRRVLQIGGSGSLWTNTSGMGFFFMLNNAYYDGTNYKYLNTDEASYYAQTTAGAHSFATAASGTAGNNVTFTERFHIDNSGNVGIGVSPGSVKLDIVGSTDAIRVSQSTTNATSKDGKYLQRHYTNSEEDLLVAYSYSTSTENGLAFGGGSGAQNAATLIGFYTAANNTTVSGTERLRINSSGHVGIGATARFYLDGTAGTGDTYMLESSANIIDVYAGGQACSFQSTAFTALVDNNLNLGFSTLFRWKAVYAVNGTIQTSDARRKREIEPSDLGSDFLRAIAPVSFIYEDMPHRRYGLIAQDIIAAANGRSLEGIITQDDDEKGYYGLNYAALVTPLVSGWQDHDSRIAALEAKIAALEARIH